MEIAIQNAIAGGGPAPPPPPPTPMNLCTQFHTVAPGEGCWQIADAASPKLTPCCDAATSPFMKLNPYLRCDATSPAAGDKLCVRGCAKTYTVQAGDNCFQIATNNQVTYNPDFINMNPKLNADAGTCTINAGDIVCVALPAA
ncbi:MAG: hypothetical protein J3K34DRAFT_410979 [Monoraphidium minutum]|nr:MAG: hypothetical protein J3K34DRAFT_410979 [Monoraphidium minutum]